MASKAQYDGKATGKGQKGEAAAIQGPEAPRTGPSREEPVERIEPDEVKQWAAKLNVTPRRLREAVRRVGPVVSDVRRFLETA